MGHLERYRLISLLPRKSLTTRSKGRSFARAASTDSRCHKSFGDIPTKRGFLPAALDLMRSGGPGYLHEHCDRRHKELGPIYRERLGSAEMVFIADTKMIQAVIANEGSRPHHNVPEAWMLYNQMRRIERGLFFQVGNPWLRLRRTFNKVLLTDASKITRFTGGILGINNDLFNTWQLTAMNQINFMVDDIKFELCKWSIEATGLMLFGHRMGCIPASGSRSAGSKRAEKLVNHVADMFEMTSNFQVLPCRLAKRLKLSSWQKFEAASDGMIELANGYTKEFLNKNKENKQTKSLVRDLIDLQTLNEEEISRSMVDLIIAAADTTSNSLQWMLYILAKYPEVQQTIRREVEALGEDLDAFQNIKQSCPYLCAFVKEVSRLYPTAPFLARTLDRAISLGGYSLPARVPIVFSLYTTSRMSAYFEDPLVFKPERWLRIESESQTKLKSPSHAYASLPFGVGARMCVGRRLADLEMHLLIASFVLRFSASPADNGDVGVKLKMILSPDRPIRLSLRPLLN